MWTSNALLLCCRWQTLLDVVSFPSQGRANNLLLRKSSIILSPEFSCRTHKFTHCWSATPKDSCMLKSFLSNTLTAIFKHWMSIWLCWLCLWVYFITQDTFEDTTWKTLIHPIPANTSTVVGVSLWPRISILALNYLLAPCVSMKIFHLYESAFSHEKLLHQNIPYQLQFCFTSKRNAMARPACWEF